MDAWALNIIGLNEVDFPARVCLEQENSDRRSYGAEAAKTDDELKVYNKTDTIFGVTF